MQITEKQLGALERMCGHKTGDSYEVAGYTLTMLGLDRYRINFPTSPNGHANDVVGINKDTELPISIQSILKQMYANWLIEIKKKKLTKQEQFLNK